MLGVNERHLTVRHHSGEAAKRRCSGLGVANRDRSACRNGYFGRGSFGIGLAGSVAGAIAVFGQRNHDRRACRQKPRDIPKSLGN